LVRELRLDSTAELFFINGPVPAYPPEGFEEFFGVGPYYRFMRPSASEEASGGDVLDRIRNFPKGATAEDQMRELMRGGAATVLPEGNVNNSAAEAMEYLYHIMEEDGPFDGIIGYSEGATVAGCKYCSCEAFPAISPSVLFVDLYRTGRVLTRLPSPALILHEQRRAEMLGMDPMFKFACFFAGWPPLRPELDAIVLADESDLMITIPTCHVSKYINVR